MKSLAALALPVLLLGLPTVAFALRFEGFGNQAHVGSMQPQGIIDVVNSPSRVYWVSGDGPHNYFFHGDARALEETLGKFARVKEEDRQFILLPGPAQTHSFEGKPIEFNWQLNLASGRYLTTFKPRLAILRAYVNVSKPRPLNPKTVEKWLADLDSEQFGPRDKAMQELTKLGNDAKPFLRAALKAQPNLEKRRRIDSLLERLPPGYDVTDFEIPAGLTLVSVDDLLTAHLKKLQDPDIYQSGLAMDELAPLAPYSDKVVPALITMLDKSKNEWVRRVAAVNLADIGSPARSALPALKEGLDDPDVNIRKVFQSAIEKLEKAKPAAAEDTQRKLAIAQDIRELKKDKEK